MEVGQVRDPEPVELARQSGQRQLELSQPRPARLEPAPAGGDGREGE
jgi:hypothetical protein